MPKDPGMGTMLMVNILICDNSAYSLITCWNDAALVISNELYDNDIVLLKTYNSESLCRHS